MTVDADQPWRSDRRKSPRYPHGDLGVQVHKMGIGGVLRATRATECIDFSLSGLQVLCAQQFSVGEHVIIDMSLLDVRVQEMTGIVCTVRAEGGGFRYGIRFCFEAGKHMRTSSVSDCLRRIASYLKQNFVYS